MGTPEGKTERGMSKLRRLERSCGPRRLTLTYTRRFRWSFRLGKFWYVAMGQRVDFPFPEIRPRAEDSPAGLACHDALHTGFNSIRSSFWKNRSLTRTSRYDWLGFEPASARVRFLDNLDFGSSSSFRGRFARSAATTAF